MIGWLESMALIIQSQKMRHPPSLIPFFAQVGSNLAKNINEMHGAGLEHDRSKPIGYHGTYDSYVWQPITYDDVLKQVSTIQVHKARGFPLVATKIWKVVFTEFALILTHLLNCSMTSGIFPNKWKTGTMIPIQKVSNPT